MDPHKSTRSDSNSPLLVSEVDIENVLALNSDYIENLINIDSNYLSTLIDSMELLEEIKLGDDNVDPLKRNISGDDNVDPLKRNISDAIIYLKQLENSKTQTNEKGNDNSEVVKVLANYGDKDNDNVRCVLEFEDVLEDISANNEHNEKMVIGETDKDNEVTADDKFGHSRMGNILQYPRKEVIAKGEVNEKNMDAANTNGDKDVSRSIADIESHVKDLEEESIENHLPNDTEIIGTENENLDRVYVAILEEGNESKENNDDLAEYTEVMKTLSKDLNGLEIPEEFPPNEINRNMESNLEILSKKFDSNDYTREETSYTSVSPGIGISMDLEDIILKHIITQLQPRALLIAREDKQITDNAESSKIYTSLQSSSEVNAIVDDSAINSDEDDSNDSFHSSDFEEITEDEAALNGLIVTINRKLDFSVQDQGSTNSHLRPLERRDAVSGDTPMRQSWNNNQRYEDDDDEDDSNDSFHSSDFEEITEDEAALNGLIVPINRKLDFSVQDQESTNSHLRPLERRDAVSGDTPMRQSWNNNQRYEDDDVPLSNLARPSHQIFNQAGPSSQRSSDKLNQARPSQRHEPMDTLNQARPSQRHEPMDTLNQARPSQRHEPMDTLNQARPSQRHEPMDTLNQERSSQRHEPMETLNQAGPSQERYYTNQARPSNTQRTTRNYQDMIKRATNRWIKDNGSANLDEDFESLDETARANHTMQEGDDYLRLFQELHVPMPTRFMENKSTHYRTVGGMQIEDNGPGFDDDEAHEMYLNMYAEYRPEANRTFDMILEAYPEDNADSRRRRRRRN